MKVVFLGAVMISVVFCSRSSEMYFGGPVTNNVNTFEWLLLGHTHSNFASYRLASKVDPHRIIQNHCYILATHCQKEID